MFTDGVWTDWIIWETFPDADNSMKKSEANESAMAFTSLIAELIEYSTYPLERCH